MAKVTRDSAGNPAGEGNEYTTGNSLNFANLLVIRHGTELLPVFVQSLLVLASIVLVIGVIYFIFFITFMIFHHLLQDRQLDRIPPFVHFNDLPQSDTESMDDEEKEALEYYEEMIRRRHLNEERSQPPSKYSEGDDAEHGLLKRKLNNGIHVN